MGADFKSSNARGLKMLSRYLLPSLVLLGFN